MQQFKAFIRDVIAQALYATGMSHPKRACAGKLLILTFHRVLPRELRDQYPMPGLVVTPEELHWILSSLLPYFDVATVTEASRRLATDALPKPLLAVSFDDGQWDNLEYAAPVLERSQVKATFYLPTDYIGGSKLLWHDEAAFAWVHGRTTLDAHELEAAQLNSRMSVARFLEELKLKPAEERRAFVHRLAQATNFNLPPWARLLTWEEVRQLRTMGHEIGSHSCSHPLLPQLSEEAQRQELVHSKLTIEGHVGSCVSMCYPNGSYDTVTVELTQAVGFENAVTTQWGVNGTGHSKFELLRCDMDAQRLLDRRGQLSAARMAMRLSGFQPGLAA